MNIKKVSSRNVIQALRTLSERRHEIRAVHSRLIFTLV